MPRSINDHSDVPLWRLVRGAAQEVSVGDDVIVSVHDDGIGASEDRVGTILQLMEGKTSRRGGAQVRGAIKFLSCAFYYRMDDLPPTVLKRHPQFYRLAANEVGACERKMCVCACVRDCRWKLFCPAILTCIVPYCGLLMDLRPMRAFTL